MNEPKFRAIRFIQPPYYAARGYVIIASMNT